MNFLKVGLMLLLFMRIAANLRRTGSGEFGEFTRSGQAYGFQYQRHKGKVNGICLRLEILDSWRFVLRQETRFDRLAKTLGIASEWQTGDQDFDAKVFILSEDAALNQAMSKDAELRAALDRLMDREGAQLECKDGMLYCQYDWLPRSQKDENKAEGEDQVVAAFPGELTAMAKVRDALRRVQAGRWQEERDPTLTRKAWLIGISMLLAVMGIVALFFDVKFDGRQVVYEAIPLIATGVTAGVLATLLLALFAWLRSTPHTHSVLLDILLAAAPGCWMAANFAATVYNQEFDLGAPEQVPVQVLYVDYKKNRKRRDYFLAVERWPDPRGEQRVRIEEHEYQWMKNASCITVTWRRGRLGDGWVSDYPGDCRITANVEK